MDFYDNFLKLCVENGIKPSKMVESIGIKKTAASNWKSRKTKPTAYNLQKIAEYFGVTVEYLKGEEQEIENSPEEPKLSEGEKMLLDLFRQIPEERQPEALELLQVALKMQKKP